MEGNRGPIHLVISRISYLPAIFFSFYLFIFSYLPSLLVPTNAGSGMDWEVKGTGGSILCETGVTAFKWRGRAGVCSRGFSPMMLAVCWLKTGRGEILGSCWEPTPDPRHTGWTFNVRQTNKNKTMTPTILLYFQVVLEFNKDCHLPSGEPSPLEASLQGFWNEQLTTTPITKTRLRDKNF